MKTILSQILVLVFLFGCSDNPGIVELSDDVCHVEFVSTNNRVHSDVSESKLIEGEEGGEVNFELVCSNSSAAGVLEFPEMSFMDNAEVSVLIPQTENNCAVIDLFPHDIILDKPIYLTLKFSGMNFKKGDKIDFKMINDNEEIIDLDYGRLIIDYENNWALVIDAKIYEFTKMGFTTIVN